MQAVILAGGFGTRISEETQNRPKPMIEIGGMPILWHIMKIYSRYGINDFVVCLGYRGYFIKEYFANYMLHRSNVTLDLSKGDMTLHNSQAEPWRVSLIDTGLNSMTGGRIKRVAPYIDGDTFLLTYGDGVSDIDIKASIDFHRRHGKKATVTMVSPPGRFGVLQTESDGRVVSFREKPADEVGLINGGYFVLNKSAIETIEGDATVWEREPMESLASSGELVGYRHPGFWQCVDTLRDKVLLEQLWDGGSAPWKTW
jgi:glucose-1-phosphate cytidylyltransferase